MKSVSKDQQALIKGLEWTIKVISSHSLYAYEFKDEDYLNQMSDDNPDFKQFVDFVNSYNDQVIEMNKKNLGEITSLNTKRPITRKNTFVDEEEKKKVQEEEKQEPKKQKIDDDSNKKTKQKDNNKKVNNNKEILDNIIGKKKKQMTSHNTTEKSKEIHPKKKNAQDQNKKVNFKDNNNKIKVNSKGPKKTLLQLLKKNFSENNIESKEIETEANIEKNKRIDSTKSQKILKSYSPNKIIKKRQAVSFPQNQKIHKKCYTTVKEDQKVEKNYLHLILIL
jgi:hypothetical protein